MKNTPLKIINLLLFLGGSFLAGSGFLLAWRLPPGSRGGHGLRILGMNRHEWGDWHLYAGIAIILLTILHMFYNRTWLEKIAARKRLWPLLGGLGLGAVIIAFFLLVPVEEHRERGGGNRTGNEQADH